MDERLETRIAALCLAAWTSLLGVAAAEEAAPPYSLPPAPPAPALTSPGRPSAKTTGAPRPVATPLLDRLAQANPSIETSPQWQQIRKVCTEAQAIVVHPVGSYPFDGATKKRLLRDLSTAGKNVDTLVSTSLVAPAEASLLKKDLETLTQTVSAFRTTDGPRVTCYDMGPPVPARDSLQRLSERLDLLQGALAAKTLHPQVISHILATIDRDLAVLDRADQLKKLSPIEEQHARSVRDKVRAQVQQLRKKTGLKSRS